MVQSVNGPLPMGKADIFATKLGNYDFKASQGKLDRFKRDTTLSSMYGESAAVQPEQVDS